MSVQMFSRTKYVRNPGSRVIGSFELSYVDAGKTWVLCCAVLPAPGFFKKEKRKKKNFFKFRVVVHAFNPSTLEAETSRSLEFEARLVYIVIGQSWLSVFKKRKRIYIL